jgi:hypothetical protein
MILIANLTSTLRANIAPAACSMRSAVKAA